MEKTQWLSVIVPVWREGATLVPVLRALAELRASGHEVIVVDGGSDDGSAETAAPWCDRVLVAGKGRAHQMNAGAAVARGEVLLFLHADTRLPATALADLSRFYHSDHGWGRFDVRLSGRRKLFRVIAWCMNRRSWLTGIATGDQAMFVRRNLFEQLGGFTDMPLMEDIELSRRLRNVTRPFCIARPVMTNSRRWEQQGAWRTIWLMWTLRWRYWRGESPDVLAKVYRSDVRNHSS
nr:TIGR04283 family arsenosugar biosynthesis glycosyltransferase [Marinobacter sp. X15-166B]